MFTTGVSPVTRHSLALLGKLNFLGQFYLAGGTACALRLGHRLSYDLDFFTQKDFVGKELLTLMRKNGDFKLDQIKKNTLLGVFENTKVSFFKYDYPVIDKLELFDGIKVAGIKDLIAMKIDAIATRGVKRDFIDLYFLSQKIKLIDSFNYYTKKYVKQNLNLLHAVRSLTYFIDTEKDEMPEMLKSCDWQEVKKYFLTETPKLLDKLLRTV